MTPATSTLTHHSITAHDFNCSLRTDTNSWIFIANMNTHDTQVVIRCDITLVFTSKLQQRLSININNKVTVTRSSQSISCERSTTAVNVSAVPKRYKVCTHCSIKTIHTQTCNVSTTATCILIHLLKIFYVFLLIKYNKRQTVDTYCFIHKLSCHLRFFI